jgi:hypothetical protein
VCVCACVRAGGGGGGGDDSPDKGGVRVKLNIQTTPKTPNCLMGTGVAKRSKIWDDQHERCTQYGNCQRELMQTTPDGNQPDDAQSHHARTCRRSY